MFSPHPHIYWFALLNLLLLHQTEIVDLVLPFVLFVLPCSKLIYAIIISYTINNPLPDIPNVHDIENALSAVCPSASVAVTVKLEVAAAVYCVWVPVIVQLPVPLVNVNPVAGGLGEQVKDTASVQVNVWVEIAEFPAKLPKEPLAVTHVGLSETVNIAVPLLTALPSGFSTLIK